jgi:uncharacterized protein
VAESLWAAFALVLVIEGLLPFVAPGLWRENFTKLVTLNNGQLRFVGLASILSGLIVLWLIRHA